MQFDFIQDIIRIRHELHQIPELAGQEFKTSALIRRELAAIPGVEVLEPFLGTDVAAVIKGGKGPGKCVLLRGDMDALPGNEETGCEYPSQHPGFMHACGHDMHCAILLGAVRNLAAQRESFAGTVRFVFQPGEENKAMGRAFVEAGGMGTPLPDYCAALHVEPGKKRNLISVRNGAMMASCCHFKVTVRGRGGHGSLPSACRSPLIAAAAMVMELQSVVPNRIDPRKAGVLSICQFESGKIDNVIPDDAVLAGTIRSLDNDTAKELETALHEVCNAVAAVHRVECEVHSEQSYMATINSAEAVEIFCESVKKTGLELHIRENSDMSSEDFSFYLAKVPGVFFRLGAGEELPPLHNTAFMPPDEIISAGITAMSQFALDVLK